MANANKIRSQDIDWSASTGYAAGAFLGHLGIFSVPAATSPVFSNVVFVAMNGDDTTALTAFTANGNKGVLGYPFLTLAAARSAAVSLSPAGTFANPRALIKVMGGYYKEQLVLANFVDWDLSDATIDLQAGALYTIDDNNVACDSIIYGNATILRSTAGTLGCIRTQNASTSLKLNAYLISSSIENAIVCTNGEQIITASKYIASNATTIQYTATCAAGTQTINANLYGYYSAALCSGGEQIINGNYAQNHQTSGGGSPVFYSTGGTQRVNTKVFSGCNLSALCAGGTQIINESRILHATTGREPVEQTSGTMILKDCTIIAGSTYCIDTASSIQLQGYNTSNKDPEVPVTFTGGGTLVINSGTT